MAAEAPTDFFKSYVWLDCFPKNNYRLAISLTGNIYDWRIVGRKLNECKFTQKGLPLLMGWQLAATSFDVNLHQF